MGITTPPINGYTQLNSMMKAYLNEVDYTDVSYQSSMLSRYIVNTTTKYHKPEGYTFSIPTNGRMLYLYDAESCMSFPVRQGSFTVYQLIPGIEYTFLFVDDEGNHLDAGIITPEPGVRIINTQKTANVRDLGGWKCDGGTIKYGKIYRGGEIREEDVALLRDTLGIRAQLNLRWDSELEYDVSPLGSDIDYRHINGPNYNLGKGSRWSDDAHKQILDTVMDNAIAGVPLYFHCGAGADRTGTFAFLIEALLGVSSSDMDKDYELTSFTTNIDTDLHARRRDEEEWKSLMDQVDRYPGTIQRDKVLHWALEKGVSLDKINEFRTAMIDGNPEPLTDN